MAQTQDEEQLTDSKKQQHNVCDPELNKCRSASGISKIKTSKLDKK